MKIRRSKRAKRRARGRRPEQVHFVLGLTVDGKFKGTRAQRKFQRARERRVIENFRTLRGNLPPMPSIEELASVQSMTGGGAFYEFFKSPAAATFSSPQTSLDTQLRDASPMTAEEIAQQLSVRRAIRYLEPFIENAQPLDFNEEPHGT